MTCLKGNETKRNQETRDSVESLKKGQEEPKNHQKQPKPSSLEQRNNNLRLENEKLLLEISEEASRKAVDIINRPIGASYFPISNEEERSIGDPLIESEWAAEIIRERKNKGRLPIATSEEEFRKIKGMLDLK